MESTFLKQLKFEDTIEIKCDSQTVIEKLLQYNQSSKYHLKYNKCDNLIYFVKKAGTKERSMVYYISGEIIPSQSKTTIKIYSVYDKFYQFIYYVPLVLSIILFIIEFFFLDYGVSLTTFEQNYRNFVSILFPLSIVLSIYAFFNTKRNKNNDLVSQKHELLDRIKTIKEQCE